MVCTYKWNECTTALREGITPLYRVSIGTIVFSAGVANKYLVLFFNGKKGKTSSQLSWERWLEPISTS